MTHNLQESVIMIDGVEYVNLLPSVLKTELYEGQGFVELFDMLPRLVPVGRTADLYVTRNARTSTGKGDKSLEEDNKLVKYLRKHQHTSPSESVVYEFRAKIPIFVSRELVRHRTACISGDAKLYFDLPDKNRNHLRHIYKLPISNLYNKWNNPQIIKTFKKDTYISSIDIHREYNIKELASIVKRSVSNLKSCIGRGQLKQTTPNIIKGEEYIKWATHPQEIKFDKRPKIKLMKIRMCNEETGIIEHSHITDIWQTGIKPVFEVELKNGYKIKTTKDHLFFMETGWMTLEQAVGLHQNKVGNWTWNVNNPGFATNGKLLYQSKEWMTNQRSTLKDLNTIAQEANCSKHTIKKWLKKFNLCYNPTERSKLGGLQQKGKTRGPAKKPYNLSEKARIIVRKARSGSASNWWKGGVSSERELIGQWTRQHAKRVHKEYNYICVICNLTHSVLHAHHIDPVWHNIDKSRDINNLVTLCKPCHINLHKNNLDLIFLKIFNTTKDFSNFGSVSKQIRNTTRRPPGVIKKYIKLKNITYIGEEMTYDLSVEGPYHNFICNGFIVHNSFNEFSMRYAQAPNEMYFPPLRLQSQINKQSSSDVDINKLNEINIDILLRYNNAIERCKNNYDDYNFLLEQGIARECARSILPVSMMTVIMIKMDMHNLMHFLKLRMACNAQKEIRDLAIAMYNLVKKTAPESFGAFNEFDLIPLGINQL